MGFNDFLKILFIFNWTIIAYNIALVSAVHQHDRDHLSAFVS